jgi:hypothetical protein
MQNTGPKQTTAEVRSRWLGFPPLSLTSAPTMLLLFETPAGYALFKVRVGSDCTIAAM